MSHPDPTIGQLAPNWDATLAARPNGRVKWLQMDDQERWYAENIELRDQVVADVGANVGRLSQFFWEASGHTSRVVSIEPVPENVARIRERIAAAGTDRWTVVPCAASSVPGTVEMNVFRMPEGPMNSVVRAAAGTSGVGGSADAPAPDGTSVTADVPAKPLAELVPDATVVKVDIEGHEYPVLEQALPELSRVHTWTVELHMVAGQPLERVLQRFADHGYRVYAAGRRPDDPKGPWISAPVPTSLSWSRIPVAQVRADGSVFKMLHILAKRA